MHRIIKKQPMPVPPHLLLQPPGTGPVRPNPASPEQAWIPPWIRPSRKRPSNQPTCRVKTRCRRRQCLAMTTDRCSQTLRVALQQPIQGKIVRDAGHWGPPNSGFIACCRNGSFSVPRQHVETWRQTLHAVYEQQQMNGRIPGQRSRAWAAPVAFVSACLRHQPMQDLKKWRWKLMCGRRTPRRCGVV